MEGIPDAAIEAGDPPTDPEPSWAKAFEVKGILGPGEELVRQRGKHFTAYLIAWGYDSGCRTIPPGDSFSLVPAGSVGIHNARLRPPDRWVADTPTFDILYSPLVPYGFLEAYPDAYSPEEASARELFHFFRVITWPSDPVARRLALENYVRRYPDRAAKWPITRHLGRLREDR